MLKPKHSTTKQGEAADGDLVGSTVERAEQLEKQQLQSRLTVVQQQSAVMKVSTQPVRSDNSWIMEFFKQHSY